MSEREWWYMPTDEEKALSARLIVDDWGEDRHYLLAALLSDAPTVEVDEYSHVGYADVLTREDGELVPPPGYYKLVKVDGHDA